MALFDARMWRRRVPVRRTALGCAAAGLLIALCVAPAGSAEPTFAAASGALMASDAAPMRAVRVFRVYGWRSLEPLRGVIWLGVDEPYLLNLRSDCRDADLRTLSAVTLRGAHLVPGRDRLLFSARACVIDSLVRLDRNKLRAGSITPDAAEAIRLIQETPPQRKAR